MDLKKINEININSIAFLRGSLLFFEGRNTLRKALHSPAAFADGHRRVLMKKRAIVDE